VTLQQHLPQDTPTGSALTLRATHTRPPRKQAGRILAGQGFILVKISTGFL